ncbi:MAG: sulfurtransferase [Rhodocyclales bacterium]|nr:sulfurtransferase [Rhodocyclales bacterium]
MTVKLIPNAARILCAIFAGLAAAAAVAATKVPGPLVDTAWLAGQLNNPELVIIDVRDDPANFARQHTDKEKADPKAPLVGHIPGSRLLDWKQVRETREIDGVKLDKMVPTAAAFEVTMRKLGVRNGQAIVIATNGKDSNSVTMGTRVYWTLKYFGHDNMALLDGGVKKWKAESHPLLHEAVPITAGDFTAGTTRPQLLAQLGDVEKAVVGGAQLVDGRTADYYVGQNMTSDVKGKGHLPGARMLAHKDIVDEATGTFLPKGELLAMARDAGIDPAGEAITYCNTGHLGSGPWFVISELLGNSKAKLYDGSMHEWTKNTSRPLSRKWEMK